MDAQLAILMANMAKVGERFKSSALSFMNPVNYKKGRFYSSLGQSQLSQSFYNHEVTLISQFRNDAFSFLIAVLYF